MVDHETPNPDDNPGRRLWTPWRMQYVGGDTRETGCLFCNRLAGADDVNSLILHRSASAFVILNLYPYNTGHVMIVPNTHVASPEDAEPADLAELATLLPGVLGALRRVLNCHGFNIGFNVGAVAGAGVADHLHQHVVPRWTGDANFMPILGSAMVIPELIPVTYAKVRAELDRAHSDLVRLVILDPDRRGVIVTANGELPSATLEPDEPVSRTAIRAAGDFGVQASIGGWAGSRRADDRGEIALTLLVQGESRVLGTWVDIADLDALAPPARETIVRGLDQLAPIVLPTIE